MFKNRNYSQILDFVLHQNMFRPILITCILFIIVGYVAVNMSLKFGILLSGGMASLSGIVTGLVTFSGIISTLKAKCYSQNTQQSR